MSGTVRLVRRVISGAIVSMLGLSAGGQARQTIAVSQAGLAAGFPATGAKVAAISADGRFVLFGSKAPNLVANQADTNNSEDVFLLDRQTGLSILVSHSAKNATASGSGASHAVALSPDGRFVLYQSLATDLVPSVLDSNGQTDVFLWDRQTGANLLVSRAINGVSTANGRSSADAVTADGRFVLFDSAATDLVSAVEDPTQTNDVFVFDAQAGSVQLVTLSTSPIPRTGDGSSSGAGISDDGRFVLFSSSADNLVPGASDSNFTTDVFLCDRQDGSIQLVSHAGSQALQAADGESAATALTPDGRYALFRSAADDVTAGFTDANFAADDVFVFDRSSGAIELISRSAEQTNSTSDGWSVPIALTPDGRYILLHSDADDLAQGLTDLNYVEDVFVYDRDSGTMTLVSAAYGSPLAAGSASSTAAAISADGRRVLFDSLATNLTQTALPWGSPSQVYERDLQLATTTLVSVTADRTPANGDSFGKALSAAGDVALFSSGATNLLSSPVDANDTDDAFAWEASTESVQLVGRSLADLSVTVSGEPCCMTPDGTTVVFTSASSRLVNGVVDANRTDDVFVQERGKPIEVVSLSAASGQTGDDYSTAKAITPDGRFVLFSGRASNLVSGATDTNGCSDVFLFDRRLRTTELIDVAAGLPIHTPECGAWPIAMSSDARFVLFESDSNDVVPGMVNSPSYARYQNVFVRDRLAGTTSWLSRPSDGVVREDSNAAAMTPDGRFVLIESRESLMPGMEQVGQGFNVFLFDQSSGHIDLVSHAIGSPLRAANGSSAGAAVTPDGQHVLYSSNAPDLVAGLSGVGFLWEEYIWDRESLNSILLSHAVGEPLVAADGSSGTGALTPDGRFAVYLSRAATVVPEGNPTLQVVSKIVLYDRGSGINRLLTRSTRWPGQPASQDSDIVALSPDAHWVLFNSTANDLVNSAGDNNGADDAYLVDVRDGSTTLVSNSLASPTSAGDAPSAAVAMSVDASAVLFVSAATNLVPNDLDGGNGVFLSLVPAEGRGFYTLPPCRLLDTRLEKKGAPLQAGETRSYSLLGGICGIPTAASALSFNVTAVGVTATGNLQVFQEDATVPPDTTNLTLSPGRTRANNGIVSLSLDGFVALKIKNDSAAAVHVVVDVNGYFALP